MAENHIPFRTAVHLLLPLLKPPPPKTKPPQCP
jgi:hypothetical protein